MKSFFNNRFTIPHFLIIGLVLFSFVIQGCDSGLDVTQEGHSSYVHDLPDQVRFVYGKYENGEEHAVLVTLDSALVHELRTFETDGDYHSEVDMLVHKDELTINATLYYQYIHALYPAEIRLLDMNGEVIIGEYVHTTTKTAAYKYSIDDPNQVLELEEYWGEDGQEVERELSRFYSLISTPELLDIQSLKTL